MERGREREMEGGRERELEGGRERERELEGGREREMEGGSERERELEGEREREMESNLKYSCHAIPLGVAERWWYFDMQLFKGLQVLSLKHFRWRFSIPPPVQR